MSLFDEVYIKERLGELRKLYPASSKSNLVLLLGARRQVSEKDTKIIFRLFLFKYSLFFIFLILSIVFMATGLCPPIIKSWIQALLLCIFGCLLAFDIVEGYTLSNFFLKKEKLYHKCLLTFRCDNKVLDSFLSGYPDTLRSSIKKYLLDKSGGMPSIENLYYFSLQKNENDQKFMKSIKDLDKDMLDRLETLTNLEAIQAEKKNLSETISVNKEQNIKKKERL